MNEKKIIAQCSNIHKSYSLNQKKGEKLHVLKGIDIEIYEGEIITIIGASGSGKSTFLHILGGLDRPSQGSVWWGGQDIALLDDKSLAPLRSLYVGFVFQFHHLLQEFTALENVMIPLMISGASKQEAEKRARELLERVSVQNRIYHKPAELSGGEQQRVAIARALANNPRIILADEPTGNIDSVNAQQLHELLWTLNREHSQTLVIVTHNQEFLLGSHRIFKMIDGRLQQM